MIDTILVQRKYMKDLLNEKRSILESQLIALMEQIGVKRSNLTRMDYRSRTIRIHQGTTNRASVGN